MLDALQSEAKAKPERLHAPKELDRLGVLQRANLRAFQNDLPEEMRLSLRDRQSGSLFARAVDSSLPGSSDTWSSPTDDVYYTPSQFKIDNNLWSLIDAAIKSGQISRAETFVANLGHAKIWRPDRIRLCARELAQAYIKANSMETSTKWLMSMEDNLGVRPDAQMYAHLLAKVVDEGSDKDIQKLLFKKLHHKLAPSLVVEEIQIVGLERLPRVLNVLKEKNYDFAQFGEAYVELFEELTGEGFKMVEGEEAAVEKTREEINAELRSNLRGSEKINTHTKDGEEVVGLEIVKNMLLQVDGDARVGEFVDSLPYRDEIPAELLDPSKKISLFNIKNSLSEENREDFENRLEKLNQLRQMDIELRGIEAAGEQWAYKAKQAQGFTGMSKFQEQMHEWQEQMRPLVEKAIKEASQDVSQADVYPYMNLLSAKTMSIVTIIEMMRLQTTVGRSVDNGVKTTNLVTSIGQALEVEYRCTRWSEHFGQKRTFLKKLTGVKRRLKVMEMIHSEALEDSVPHWAVDIRAKIGAMLVDILIKVARMPVTAKDPVTGAAVTAKVPVFGHSYQLVKRQRHGMVRMHELMTQKVISTDISAESSEAFVTPQFLPMLATPKPWVAWKKGGYFVSQASIMRARESSEQTAYLDTASERGDLDRLFAGLNKLGSTAWTVNAKVFDVLSKVWNTGEAYLDIPAVNTDNSLPECPEHNDPVARTEWRKLCTVIINKRKSDHSVRCDSNYKLEIARAHLGEKLHFPHNVDFRGRAYPLSPHFNHLGSDLSRGLLHFWHGKELGEEGLKWLKVHMANLHGAGKANFDDRVKFVDEHMDQIRAAVADPLAKENNMWREADYPWQFLAACYELVAAYDLPDPTKFVSHIPVQQDGSCNGLQHYAALGGDIDGARQVNLTPFDKPQDVYAEVAAIVSDLVKQDAEKDHELAKFLVGKINRKIVKPTVMTNVYGVTFVGAKAQILTQLKEQYGDIPQSEDMAHYLATRVFSAMRSLFTNAHDIQDWLTECARRITKTVRPEATPEEIHANESLSSVIWTSPIGLPVVQPYRKSAKRQVDTALQSVFLQDAFTLYGVLSRKQAQAFPPNFVHSLDASHMLLTALNLGEEVSFASVHDSYWTHAADVPQMNKVLREQFVKLHSMDIVGNLEKELQERYGTFYSRVGLLTDDTDLALALGHKANKKDNNLYDQLQEDKEYRRLLHGTPAQRKKAAQNPSTVEILENHRPLDNYLAIKTITERVNGKMITKMVETEGAEKKKPFLTKFQIDQPPKKGDLNLKEVLVSPYFFS
ncbi:DNA-directed RNA polymerase [Yarrowia sp. C11]|nr:DNA-directed RNA polymerase [Yarrowia sp. E02]KAG5369699.1 DNA-directed RNA polymerase [Yarrowia sp. C11]